MSLNMEYICFNPTIPLFDQLIPTSEKSTTLFSSYFPPSSIIKTYKPIKIAASTFTLSLKETNTPEEFQGEYFSRVTRTFTVECETDGTIHTDIEEREIDTFMLNLFKTTIAKV